MRCLEGLKHIVALTGVVLILGGCGHQVRQGVIVDRYYYPASYSHSHGQGQYNAATYRFRLRGPDGRFGWIDVDADTYHEYKNGQTYP